MTWVLFALLTAFFESAKDVLGKLSLRHSDPLLVAWAWRCFSLPFLLPLLLFIDLPPLSPPFWWALLVGGGLNVVTSLLYMQAIQASDLSLTVPMVAFTPLFLLLTSPLLLNEVAGWPGAAGVVLIVAGSYLLQTDQRRQGLLFPIRALLHQRGPRLMLLVAFIWSLTAAIDKIGVQNSSPLLWAVAINLSIALALSVPVLLRLRRGSPLPAGKTWAGWLAVGAAGGVTTLCQMVAISLTLVPYVIAVKRSSAVLGVLWGHYLFGEQGVRERLAGVLVMFAGILLIVLP